MLFMTVGFGSSVSGRLYQDRDEAFRGFKAHAEAGGTVCDHGDFRLVCGEQRRGGDGYADPLHRRF